MFSAYFESFLCHVNRPRVDLWGKKHSSCWNHSAGTSLRAFGQDVEQQLQLRKDANGASKEVGARKMGARHAAFSSCQSHTPDVY